MAARKAILTDFKATPTLLRVDVQHSGKFFTEDIKKTIRENVRDGLAEWAKETETVVRELTPVGEGRHGEHLQDSIHGRVRSLQGKLWAVTAVVTPTIHLRLPRFRGYATYIETGVRQGSAVYKKGVMAGMRSGKITYRDVAAVRRGTGYQGAGMFRRGGSIMRDRAKDRLTNITKGLE